jgi:glucokinase
MNIPMFAKALLNDYDLEVSELYKLIKSNPKNLAAEDVFRVAKIDDKYAQFVVEKIGKINAIGFANIVNAYDPELITIGGSIALYLRISRNTP